MAKHGCRGSCGSAAKEQFMVCGQQSRDSSKGGMSPFSKQCTGSLDVSENRLGTSYEAGFELAESKVEDGVQWLKQ